MAAARNGQSQSLRIFVVENHPDTLVCFSLYLESLGHTVTTARTMNEALATWPLAAHDMLISDLRLPDGDGWELLVRLPFPHLIYALAISALGMAADRAKSKAAGYRHHLLKPFHLDALEEALREAAAETPSA